MISWLAIARGIADATFIIFPAPTTLGGYTTWIKSTVPIALALASSTTNRGTANCSTTTVTYTACDASAADIGIATGAVCNTTAISAEAVCCRAKSNDSIAVHQFTTTATTARTVGVKRGVVGHIFCLASFTIHLDVIDLYIATTRIIVVLDVDITRRRAGVNIILITGGQGPTTNVNTAHFEINMFRASNAAGADCNTTGTITGGCAACA